MNLNLNGNLPEKDTAETDFRKPSPMLILNEISHLMISRISKQHDELLSQRSVRLLIMELARKDGCTQLELVNATHLKAPTVSVAMQKLEKNGIVIRRPDDYDLRATRVYLTEKGRELDNRTRETVYESEDLALASFTQEEKEIFEKLLLKIRSTLLDDQNTDKNTGKDGSSF